MASPAAVDMPNGISTPPTTSGSGNANASPPASSTQPNTQQSLPNGSTQPGLQAPPSQPLTSLQDDGLGKRPQDARTLHLVLSKLGVHAYTERVPLQIMDFAYRYMSGVLSDAMAYEPPSTSHHSGAGSKKSQTNAGGPGASDDANISLAAVRTAIASRVANQFSATLPREYWAEMAAERNRIALPRVDREFGLRLPAERYCFTGVGWDWKNSWDEEVEGDDDAEETEGAAGAGGPVGGSLAGLPVGDTTMGGMDEEEEADEDQFEEVMGVGRDEEMADV